uniref:Uncharacterized protein n=1 Tax=Sphaerodactylus townsendi TaxID=933632 RepID=A0ACB8E441_9SAUR
MHEKTGPMHSSDKLEALNREKSVESPNGSLYLSDAVKEEELKKCHREVVSLAPNKYNSQYHKLFKDIPTEESVLKVFLSRVVISGGFGEEGLGVTGNTHSLTLMPKSCSVGAEQLTWSVSGILESGLEIKAAAILLFRCSLLLRPPERHPHPRPALHFPKLALFLCKPFWKRYQVHIFVSLISRETVCNACVTESLYPPAGISAGHAPNVSATHPRSLIQELPAGLPQAFRSSEDPPLATGKSRHLHLCLRQVSSKKSLSLKELTEEPDTVSLEVIVPEVKWRKGSPATLSLALPDAGFQCIHRASISSLSTKESSCNSEEPLISESAINTEEEELEVEQSYRAELRASDYQLLKVFLVLICLLVVSSSYLAFRIFRLEQQLCSLNRDYLSRVPQSSLLPNGRYATARKPPLLPCCIVVTLLVQ